MRADRLSIIRISTVSKWDINVKVLPCFSHCFSKWNKAYSKLIQQFEEQDKGKQNPHIPLISATMDLCRFQKSWSKENTCEDICSDGAVEGARYFWEMESYAYSDEYMASSLTAQKQYLIAQKLHCDLFQGLHSHWWHALLQACSAPYVFIMECTGKAPL